MASPEFSAPSPRLSDAEREHALEVLRDSAAAGRVSQDTLLRRTDVVLRARCREELDGVLADLDRRSAGPPWLYRMVGRVSAFPVLVRRAWQRERLPELLLPGPGPHPLSIGRAPGSVLRLTHHTVSRTHAQLRHTGSGWSLRDLGSSNGTWVNGRRVTGSVPVRPGDLVQFGETGFRLTGP
ncbi:FHA domain-containing protein [Streptomyces sp. TR06-5]|uniref:FHA domain-containing protein n=1 Tax=unclassified Streptomyces TaxID=2593676 RepID=UPI0039A27856